MLHSIAYAYSLRSARDDLQQSLLTYEKKNNDPRWREAQSMDKADARKLINQNFAKLKRFAQIKRLPDPALLDTIAILESFQVNPKELRARQPSEMMELQTLEAHESKQALSVANDALKDLETSWGTIGETLFKECPELASRPNHAGFSPFEIGLLTHNVGFVHSLTKLGCTYNFNSPNAYLIRNSAARAPNPDILNFMVKRGTKLNELVEVIL